MNENKYNVFLLEENEHNVNNLIWKRYRGKLMKSFYNNITIKSLFKNKLLNIYGFFESFCKNFIKSNFILSNSS